MKRKFLIVIALISSILLGTAWAAQDIQALLDSLESTKDSLLDDVKQEHEVLIDKLDDITDELSQEQDFQILQGLDKISLSSLSNKLLDDNKNLRKNILSDYGGINSEILFLEDQQQEDLISDTEYTEQYDNLESDITGYEQKYMSMINNFGSSLSGYMADFQDQYTDLVDTNTKLLEDMKKEMQKVNDINTSYDEFLDLSKRVNKLYGSKYDNINEFLSELERVTTESLRSRLMSWVINYNSAYPNLEYYDDEIDAYFTNLMNTYKVEIAAYFDELIKGIYTQDDYDFIISTYQQFKEDYYNNDELDYQTLSDLELDDVYQKLNTKLNTVNQAITQKLVDLEASTEENLGEVLKQRVIDFYENKSDQKVQQMEEFLKNQKELLDFKLEQQDQKYLNAVRSYQNIDFFGGTAQERLYRMQDTAKQLQQTAQEMIDKQKRDELMNKYWELIMQQIDLQIINDSAMNKYRMQYSSIDEQLQAIFTNIQREYEVKDKMDELTQKYDQALEKIDTFLENTNLGDKSKFYLLKIKKAIIKFRYL